MAGGRQGFFLREQAGQNRWQGIPRHSPGLRPGQNLWRRQRVDGAQSVACDALTLGKIAKPVGCVDVQGKKDGAGGPLHPAHPPAYGSGPPCFGTQDPVRPCFVDHHILHKTLVLDLERKLITV